MRTQIEVITASEEHAEGIGKVVRDAIRRVNAKDYPPHEINRLVSNFSTSNILDFLKQRLTIVAMHDNVVAGTGALQGPEIKSVFVSPDLHRRGVGSVLLGELERVASKRGVQELVVSSSLSAVKFYSALGYVEQSRKFFGEEETVVMIKSAISPSP
ncbi:MAG: GNAT family N-acetyltransferase [Ruegeria sp.]|uniref:GNAT family N-acetyltransferase n=1 Tax=Ruegeria sp. TaxID=1879320 RepID=UPI00349E5A0D